MVKLTKSQIDERWELVDPAHLNLDAQGSMWGELYRFPMYVGVAPGECVSNGFGETLQAPSDPGTYTLWQYVQDACHMGSQWERE